MKRSCLKQSVFLLIFSVLLISFVTGCTKNMSAETVTSDPPNNNMPQAISSTPSEPAESTESPLVLSERDLQRVQFNFDQYVLSMQARDILKTNAELLKSQPEWKIVIEGHCDDRGSDEYNLALGDRRAQEVKNFLVTLGISPERLKTNSYGEEMPLDASDNETAWAKNRRAEFKVLN